MEVEFDGNGTKEAGGGKIGTVEFDCCGNEDLKNCWALNEFVAGSATAATPTPAWVAAVSTGTVSCGNTPKEDPGWWVQEGCNCKRIDKK